MGYYKRYGLSKTCLMVSISFNQRLQDLADHIAEFAWKIG
jgi:hypothetical protein